MGLIFGLQITLLLARITLHEKEGKRKRLLILINLPICYFFTGIGCYLYLILIFLDEVFSKKKHSLLAWILYTLVTILLPILTYYKFDINETQAWIGIACFITQDLLHPLGIVITSFLISPLLAYGTYHLLQRLTDKKRFALNLLMAFFAIGIILSQLKNEDERLYQLHYLITHEKWDEAITFMQKKPVQNVLMSSYTNIALLHQQRLSKELFSYFQVAHVNEFWSANHLLNYLTAETYFQLDMLYAARAYMFMANTQTPSGRSPLYLTRLAEIEQTYRDFFPTSLFSYFFLDDFNNHQYKDDRNFGWMFACSALLAVFVACLGLWVVTFFSTMARVKEIGIRKVLGAGKANLFVVLTRELLLLTVLASVIGIPVSAFLMNSWLEGYAFHILQPWWVYAVAFALLMFIAFLTVVRQVWRIIRLKPMYILRSE